MTDLAENTTHDRTTEWHRLDIRIVVAYLSTLLAPAAGVAATMAFTGGNVSREGLVWLGLLCLGFLCLAGYGLLKYRTTRYCITDERVELRSAAMFRRDRVVRRDRIRTVDVSANPLYRVLGITVVKIGTGQQSSSGSSAELAIDGVPKALALQLRHRLQYGDSTSDTEVPATGALATLQWAWLRFAPLSLLGMGGVVAALGVAYQILEKLGIEPWELDALRGLGDWLAAQPLWVSVGLLVAVTVVLATLATLLSFVESWWRFRLERQGEHLRVQSGLLTTRSFSVAYDRLQGIEIAEPMLLRGGGGARTKALVAGLRDSEGEGQQPRNDLLPPAPRAEAERVVAAVLAPLPTDLTAHPRAALSRRRFRALTTVTVLVGATALTGLWWTDVLYWVAAGGALVLYPLGWAMAASAYRNLGHGVSGDHVVVRSGVFVRRTRVIRRASIIGWNLSQTPMQRRVGLATLTATLASGDGTCPVIDIALADVPRFAQQVVPGLLTPFVDES
ncbi:PH domain-containing protein [Saccharomonospora azurea]|uniref:PH domain-containing protein n=1 Tax=Saccharomonospora azurea TaxID=40988 RepID=UPI002409F93E|nr:PH domain-containing protein [Saccharomonospora azurea]